MIRRFRISVLDYNEILEFSNDETQEQIEAACDDCQRVMYLNLDSGISELTEEEFLHWKKMGSFR